MMQCREVQERLLELAGWEEIPVDMAEHIEGCAECRGLYRELAEIGERIGRVEEFGLNDIERGRLLQGINEKIDAVGSGEFTGKVSRFRWVLPSAAAVVLLVGIAITGGKISTLLTERAESPITAGTFSEEMSSIEALYDDLDAPTVETLLRDVTTKPVEEASGLLLEDLTQEEYDYLAKNFDAGELL